MELSIELVLVLTTVFLAWAGWVSRRTMKNQSALTKLTDSDTSLRNEMKELSSTLKASFVEMKNEVKEDLREVNARLDTFLTNEITALKDLAKRR